MRGLELRCVETISILLSILTMLLITGCATPWETNGSFYHSIETDVLIEYDQPNSVFLDDTLVGQAPISIPIEYEQEVQQETRKVSYWRDNPAIALLCTIGSYGIYLPFSLIPVVEETTNTPLNSFRDNEHTIRVRINDETNWIRRLHLSGQETEKLVVDLVAAQETDAQPTMTTE